MKHIKETLAYKKYSENLGTLSPTELLAVMCKVEHMRLELMEKKSPAWINLRKDDYDCYHIEMSFRRV